MRLTTINLYCYTLPLSAPLTLKGEPLHERVGFLLRLEDEAGHTGWGDAAPLPGFSRETLAEVASQLIQVRHDWQGKQLVDDPVDLETLFTKMEDLSAVAASVRFGMELAVWHLFAEATGNSLPSVLCAGADAIVSLNGLLMGGSEEILHRARQMRAAGYRAVKLKVGRQSVAEDVALVCELSDILGESVALRLDANQRWTMTEAVAFAEGIADVSIEYIEEPLRDASQLSALAEHTDLPIALDESLVGLPVASLHEQGYAHAVVLKPTLLGGVRHTLQMARVATSLDMTPVLSAAFETGIGLRGLIALAACLGEIPVGLDTYHWLAEDMLTPRLAWDGPHIDVAEVTTKPHRINERYLEPLAVS